MIDPLVVATIATGFSVLLAVAALHKISNVQDFFNVLRDYRVLPGALIVPAGYALAGVELTLAVAWLLPISRKLAAAVTILLLLTYSIAIGVNLLRGRTHIDCGCGIASQGETLISGRLLIRNMLLVLACCIPLAPSSNRELMIGDFAVVGVALVTWMLLFAAGNQLIANRSAINSWRRN